MEFYFEGLLVAQAVFARFHDEGQPAIDIFNRLFLFLLRNHVGLLDLLKQFQVRN